jgi:hypothetical protein
MEKHTLIARKWKGEYRFKMLSYYDNMSSPVVSSNLFGGSLNGYYVKKTFDESQILRNLSFAKSFRSNLEICYCVFNSLRKRKSSR